MAISLKSHLLALLREKDKRDRQRFLAQKEALAAAFQSAKEAVTKAEVAAEKRFELLNELRGGVATREQLEALDKRFIELKERMATLDGQKSGISLSAALAVTCITIIISVIGLYAALHKT